MTTNPSASNQDPTLHYAYFGGPRDGLKTGDLPAVLSGQKLTRMVTRVPLSQPHQFSLYAVYECTSETQINGFWQFHFRGLEGPNGEKLNAVSPDHADTERTQESTHALHRSPNLSVLVHSATEGLVKRHSGPATWESKVRGLMLGLALGDAIGSHRAVPRSGSLAAGAASQLAAWTAEGLLRYATRYGGTSIAGSTWNDSIRYAYHRWAAIRGVRPDSGAGDPHLVAEFRGWLQSVPAMLVKRGHSPSMERAIATGNPSGHDSCRPVIKGIPIAVYAGAKGFTHCSPSEAGEFARGVAEITHGNARVGASAAFVVRIAVHCLRAESSFAEVMRAAMVGGLEPELGRAIEDAIKRARSGPKDVDTIARISPDDTSVSVLAGAVFTVLAFPDWQQTREALDFARRAPDGDGVAAVVGAFLGALHGYEVFPTEALSRLELGWAMDRLAVDLALEAKDNQVPEGGWKEGGGPWKEPWWDAKYPGV